MLTGDVYRAAERNEYGDPVDADGNVTRLGATPTLPDSLPIDLGQFGFVGTISGLILGGQSIQPDTGGHVVSVTTDMVGVPTASPVQLCHGDVVVVGGIRYRIDGPRRWGHDHPLTGSPKRYTWVKATAKYN